MSDLVPPDEIERIVGVERHTSEHWGRAVSAEQTVYILHSAECKDSEIDLRECPYSIALDAGIDVQDWRGREDQAVQLAIDEDVQLVPLPPAQALPEPQLMGWLADHYGCRVVECGEDGDLCAVAGPERAEHVDDRRALAAVMHYLRADCGFGRADFRGGFEFRKVERLWVTVTADDDEPWAWAEQQTPGSWAITYVETF